MALKAAIDGESFTLQLLDQTQLPRCEQWITIDSNPAMIEAIQALRVRGAPLIGVAAGLMLARLSQQGLSRSALLEHAQALRAARPTAVNLATIVDRIVDVIRQGASSADICRVAVQIFQEDVALCDKMAEHGAALLEDGDRILTHCNTGGLATVGIGTALGVIRKAHEQGKKIHVYVDETRPLLQGARLTAWELTNLNIPCTLIADNMAAALMRQGRITKAIVGADRIAVNGDFANKIGTYNVAVSCAHHRLPFYVAAPYTTIDPGCASGAQIPIEQRAASEVRGASGSFGDVTWAPPDVPVDNQAFDVTPASLVDRWILDRGAFTRSEVQEGALRSC
jgi:methylthioribose-1-phosphate isomerase